ncbi:protein maelstrom homolog [Epargyreus clarus]|uniref:protein maelstrom homolog n=1 Tax=Epargyreus clarus TaxID=520877 RepID=UPI003C2D23E3
MPKKAPKNAFYFFMVDFREEQRKKGINYGKMNEVADAAGPFWRDATPAIKAKYEQIAKQEKEKNNIPDKKYTSTGIPLSEIERQEKELREAVEAELKDIKNLVKLKSFNGEIINEDFYIMDVNYYCKVGSGYLIGESTILRFNLQDGIHEIYHEIVNPGYIPVGYASDVKYFSNELGLDMPDESGRSNYMQILANTIDYLKKKDRNSKILPPIFVMPDKILPVQDFIQQMCYRAGEDIALFRVYRLDSLFFTLINAIKTRPDEGFPKESLAIQQLKKDMFKYTPGVGCSHHEESDKAIECTASRVKRQAYTILDSCCPVVGIEPQPGKHLPADYHMESILIYKEQKRGRLAPSVANARDVACSSIASDSFFDQSTLNSTSDSIKKEQRTYTPLRMPKTDYSLKLRQAPELTETNFPTLSAGHGRGRGLAGSFNKLKLNK